MATYTSTGWACTIYRAGADAPCAASDIGAGIPHRAIEWDGDTPMAAISAEEEAEIEREGAIEIEDSGYRIEIEMP